MVFKSALGAVLADVRRIELPQVCSAADVPRAAAQHRRALVEGVCGTGGGGERKKKLDGIREWGVRRMWVWWDTIQTREGWGVARECGAHARTVWTRRRASHSPPARKTGAPGEEGKG